MRPVHTFSVVPSLPKNIEGLRRLAQNLRWCWSHESVELFRRLDRDLWETCGHNPVLLLGTIEQAKLDGSRQGRCLPCAPAASGVEPGRRTWPPSPPGFVAPWRPGRSASDRLLLRRVRPDRVPLDLRRRPRHSGRRSPQVRQRPRRAAGRRRTALPAGLFPAVPQPVGMAAGVVRRTTTSTICRSAW